MAYQDTNTEKRSQLFKIVASVETKLRAEWTTKLQQKLGKLLSTIRSANSLHPRPNRKFDLIRLPLEIRLMIYEQCCNVAYLTEYKGSLKFKNIIRSRLITKHKVCPLLLIPELRHEVFPVFMAHCMITITKPSSIPPIVAPRGNIRTSLRYIRLLSVCLHPQRNGEDWMVHNWPVLEATPNLISLSIMLNIERRQVRKSLPWASRWRREARVTAIMARTRLGLVGKTLPKLKVVNMVFATRVNLTESFLTVTKRRFATALSSLADSDADLRIYERRLV